MSCAEVNKLSAMRCDLPFQMVRRPSMSLRKRHRELAASFGNGLEFIL